MTIIVDKNEGPDVFYEELDGAEALKFRKEDISTSTWLDLHDEYSYDFRVESEDGTTRFFERKTIRDLSDTWREGRLQRQIEPVDGLIVEEDAEQRLDAILRSDDEDAKEQLYVNARKHLATIAANMWVIPVGNPRECVEVLRYIEERGSDLDVRENKVHYNPDDPRMGLLETFYRVNTDRIGDELEEIVNWTKLRDALNLGRWEEVPGLGPKTLEKIRNDLR